MHIYTNLTILSEPRTKPKRQEL